MGRGRLGGEGLCKLKEIGTEWKGRLLQIFCYRAGDETGRLDLEERRERWRSVVNLLPLPVSVAWGFPGNACWSWSKLGLNNEQRAGG